MLFWNKVFWPGCVVKKIRPGWLQCTYHGNSATKLSHSGTRTTQSVGPTQKRWDVTPHEHVSFIYIYLYTCIVTWIYSSTDIYINANTHIYVYTPIHTYVYKHRFMYVHIYIYIYMYIYIYICIYTCIHTRTYTHFYIYVEHVTYLWDSLTHWLSVCCIPSQTPIAHHIHTHAHAHTMSHARSYIGLVERKGYIWQSDCPKESDEVLIFSIKTPNLFSCLQNASHVIVLVSTGNSNNCYRNWRECGKV